jgi:hypothetical protein
MLTEISMVPLDRLVIIGGLLWLNRCHSLHLLNIFPLCQCSSGIQYFHCNSLSVSSTPEWWVFYERQWHALMWRAFHGIRIGIPMYLVVLNEDFFYKNQFVCLWSSLTPVHFLLVNSKSSIISNQLSFQSWKNHVFLSCWRQFGQ